MGRRVDWSRCSSAPADAAPSMPTVRVLATCLWLLPPEFYHPLHQLREPAPINADVQAQTRALDRPRPRAPQRRAHGPQQGGLLSRQHRRDIPRLRVASPPAAARPARAHRRLPRTYSARLAFYRTKQFQCEVTGKGGLTYFQALDSELSEARTLHARFPEPLKPAV